MSDPETVSIEIPVQHKPWCFFHDGEPDFCPHLVGHPQDCALGWRLTFEDLWQDALEDRIIDALRGLDEARQIVNEVTGRTPSSRISEGLTIRDVLERVLLCPDGIWLTEAALEAE